MIIERQPNSPEKRPQPKPTPARANLDRLFLYQRGDIRWDQMISFRSGPKRQGHRLIFWSLMAVSIDGLILISASCIFVLVFAALMKSPLSHLLIGFSKMSIVKLFGVIFCASAWTYLISLRILFGFSIGEWACELRLGQPTQRLSKSYPVKVLLRTTITLVTGLVTLPILSMMSGKDLAGRIANIRLMSLR